ncbi:peptidase C15 [Trichothermofontia sp.]
MANSLLLTSFATWKAEQTSNASDDLLEILLQNNWLQDSHHLLRQVPVDFDLGPAQVIAKVETVQPDIVVCCGMAEDRDELNIETQAVSRESEARVLTTTIDCSKLLPELRRTRLSQDAGRFVCNHLYYSVLHYLRTSPAPSPWTSKTAIAHTPPLPNTAEVPVRATSHCIFIHVPILLPDNKDHIVSDFLTILHRLQSLVTC